MRTNARVGAVVGTVIFALLMCADGAATDIEVDSNVHGVDFGLRGVAPALLHRYTKPHSADVDVDGDGDGNGGDDDASVVVDSAGGASGTGGVVNVGGVTSDGGVCGDGNVGNVVGCDADDDSDSLALVDALSDADTESDDDAGADKAGSGFRCLDDSAFVPWAAVNDDYCDCYDGECSAFLCTRLLLF
jgi:hypothetical protein